MTELTVYTTSGQELTLNETRKSGGEGKIYSVKGNQLLCAKIYFKRAITDELIQKITAMIKNAPEDPTWSVIGYRSIAWPISIVFFDFEKTRFAGYTMPLIDTRVFKESHIYYDPADRIRDLGGTFTWKYLMTAAFNIANAVTAIHQKGHCIGDLRENNILVSPTTLISIVDCDSFQIRDNDTRQTFYTRVGTGEFLPPELHSVNFKENDHERIYSDRFALGILIFKFLMMGVHPYQAKGSALDNTPSLEGKVKKGLFPYDDSKIVQPPDYAPNYEIIPAPLKQLFSRCFVEGHRDRLKRPTARDWLDALRDAIEKLKECRTNRNHVYSDHLPSCPWCRMDKDYFPNAFLSGHQMLLPVPGTQAALQTVQSAAIWCSSCGVPVEFDFNNCPNCAMLVADMT
ncbi:MAG: protein kinase [Nitrospirae bacterium]|nr:protein kinase [Nitrospirota bacterium]